MASIVTSILSSTVGLLLNKARNKIADKLKDGDITDAKIREIIVRELNDVKTKLDGLSRKDLLSSYNFLQEGVNLLRASLDKSEEEEKAVLNDTHGDGGETTTKPGNAESGILIGALTLSQTMRTVKFSSDEEFQSAKKRFEDARKKATEAFCIETLSIEDRIFAAKLRIVSELLECVERPDTAIINCLPFLEKLHSLPAIREIFSVYINGGYKSMFNKAERVENIKSVMLTNYVLFQLVSECSSKYCSTITWPIIELGDRSFHPILHCKKITTRRSWGEEFIRPPNEVILDEDREDLNPDLSAVNSHGEIIAAGWHDDIYIISKRCEVKMVLLNYLRDAGAVRRRILGLAVNSRNNIFVLEYLKTRTDVELQSYVLYVFDVNYHVKQKCILHFIVAKIPVLFAKIAINKNNNVIINMIIDSIVYVCDNAGQLKHRFKPDTSVVRSLATSDKNEILTISDDLKAAHRYTEKGELTLTIEVPESHEILSVAWHHVICKIMVLTNIRKNNSYFLLCFSETGELDKSTLLFEKDKIKYPVIRSHPSGPAAVVGERSINFI